MKIINIKQQKNPLSSMSSPIVFDLAIKYKPDLAKAYNNKGVALNKLGKYSQSEEAFSKAKQLRAKH
ncbi:MULTISPECIES: tetratricopeptide repeat protein [unclassified Candidatus Tisiphia]|uniref:tetratricopeptide repeat protein n=1 Tax=unclassified Candidatus Tisiphia TaxID=2996318 RepID=UPI00312C8E02